MLLLDEIEKAHPDLFNLLLQVMDHGALTDNNGRKSDFRNVVLIMTSNVGARDLSRRMPGFANSDEQRFGDIDEAFKRAFSPEFRNRLDAKVDFAPLQESVMLQIVDKFVAELGTQLGERKVTVELTGAARAYLAKKGFDPLNGARLSPEADPLLVMMRMTCLKSLFLPLLSVSVPWSITCRRMLNTSGCAFSISSSSRTEYGFFVICSVRRPPCSNPT